MNHIHISILGALVLGFAACAAPEAETTPQSEQAETREQRPRFKAVELYSWQDAQGAWLFSMVDGTNRLKPVGEIQKPENTVVGPEALASAFSMLAEGEQVYWLHHVRGFAYPPEALCDRLTKVAQEAGVQLSLPTLQDRKLRGLAK